MRDRAARLVQSETREVFAAAGLDPADIGAEATVRLDRFVSHPIAGHERAAGARRGRA